MAGSLTAGTTRRGVGLLESWRAHLRVFAITLVAELIGNVGVPLGVTSVVDIFIPGA